MNLLQAKPMVIYCRLYMKDALFGRKISKRYKTTALRLFTTGIIPTPPPLPPSLLTAATQCVHIVAGFCRPSSRIGGAAERKHYRYSNAWLLSTLFRDTAR